MGNQATSFRDLLVWQRAMDASVEVLRLARILPRELRDSLGDQMRRAAISVVSNIAEGHGRRHRKEYIHHVAIASGSLKEMETQLLLLRRHDSRFAEDVDRILAITDETGRMLTGLYRALKSPRSTPDTRG